jgi:hypothetical protein
MTELEDLRKALYEAMDAARTKRRAEHRFTIAAVVFTVAAWIFVIMWLVVLR